MTATYWEAGRRIVEFQQGGKARAAYGEEILERLAQDLTSRFGRGFGVSHIRTTEIYAHIAPDYLRTAVAKLQFQSMIS